MTAGCKAVRREAVKIRNDKETKLQNDFVVIMKRSLEDGTN